MGLPQSITIREEIPLRKALGKPEKRELRYLSYHLEGLAKAVPHLVFEIQIQKGQAHPYFVLQVPAAEIEIKSEIEIPAIKADIKSLINIVENIFALTFEGIQFKLLKGPALHTKWEEMYGPYWNDPIKIYGRTQLEITRKIGSTYLSILKFEGTPAFKIINNASQMDSLIDSLMGCHLAEVHYVVAATPLVVPPSEPLPITTFPSSTERWQVSCYLIVTSPERTQLEEEVRRVQAIATSIFGIEPRVLETNALKRSFPSAATRILLENPLTLTSPQLAFFLHLPERHFKRAEWNNGEMEILGALILSPGLTLDELMVQLKSNPMDAFYAWDLLKVKRALQNLLESEEITCIRHPKEKVERYMIRED